MVEDKSEECCATAWGDGMGWLYLCASHFQLNHVVQRWTQKYCQVYLI